MEPGSQRHVAHRLQCTSSERRRALRRSESFTYDRCMARQVAFKRELQKLWKRRTGYLMSLVRQKPGPVATLTRRQRERAINELQEIATSILLAGDAKHDLDDLVVHRHRRLIRGHGYVARFATMTRGLAKITKPIVYSFWKGKKCLYVGTGKSWRRLNHYQKSIYLHHATSMHVAEITSRSYLGKAECLSTHIYEPRDNKVKAATQKWGKVCPICETHDAIRMELRALFSLK
jgi:hypothetical protein